MQKFIIHIHFKNPYNTIRFQENFIKSYQKKMPRSAAESLYALSVCCVNGSSFKIFEPLKIKTLLPH